MKDEIERKNKLKKKKLNQPGITRLTCNPGYEIRITSSKKKQKKSQSGKLNNLIYFLKYFLFENILK